MDLDSVADELYGLAPEQFTAARNQRAKQAKSDGDRELAASIQALSRPNAVAALANQLVRRHGDELAPLLELGEGLRAATAALSGPELRTLGQQRHRLIAALVATARDTAEQDGRSVTGDAERGLEETLHAALADEAAAEQLMAGRLTDALHRSGLGGAVDASAPPGRTGRSAVAPRRSAPGRAGGGGAVAAGGGGGGGSGGGGGQDALAAKRAERQQAERDAAEARKQEAVADVEQANSDLAQAQADADEGAAAVDQANASVTQLREQLDRATAEQHRLEHAQQRLRTEVERAQRAVRVAQRHLDSL